MDSVAVLDFGCQYTHQIGEAVRRAGVFSEILPCETPVKELERFRGIILSGGPDSVYGKGSPRCERGVFSMGKPVLGICYGLQLMAHELGGEVRHTGKGEYGEGRIKVKKESPLLEGLGEGVVWMSHGDSVVRVPEGFGVLAESDGGLLAAMGDEGRRLYGLQFHPEVAHTERGERVIRNFVLGICGCNLGWKMDDFIESATRKIKEHVGDGRAVIFASGGVDSTVAAVLCQRALGERVRAIHIDNGFERKGEAAWVRKTLKEAGVDVEVIDSSRETLERIGKELYPERKRHIIGDAYIEALFRSLEGFESDERAFLVQGTIYPDTIESSEGVGNKADLIKSHHNVASGLVKRLREKGRLVEPNTMLFKHEVREIARLLGLPRELSERHPFPGPGLGVRYVGNVSHSEDFENNILKSSDILGEYGCNGVVAPIGNVGVKGSARKYGNVVLISGDRSHYEKICEASNRLGNEIAGITRAAYIIDGKEHSQEEWSGIKRMPITRNGIDLLREADSIAMSKLEGCGLYKNISQMPIVLFPGPEKPWVALRPVVTPDFMTLRTPRIPQEITWEYLEGCTKEILALDLVDGVVLDTTNKPPGTTEWE